MGFRRLLTLAAGSACLVAIGCRPAAHIPETIVSSRDQWEPIRAALSAGGGAAEEVARPDPTGWASLSGTFRFAAGDIAQLPAPRTLEVGGDDAAVCGKGGAPKSEEIVVAANGGLANVFVYLADNIPAEEKWTHPSAAPGRSEPVVFDQENCVFLTHALALQTGQPLEIHNSDPVGHNTNILTTPFNSSIAPGAVVPYEHRGESRSPLTVKCSVHPWMTAFVLFRKNGYFAVTDEDGKFQIENLPAGVDLTFKVWHEQAKIHQVGHGGPRGTDLAQPGCQVEVGAGPNEGIGRAARPGPVRCGLAALLRFESP